MSQPPFVPKADPVDLDGVGENYVSKLSRYALALCLGAALVALLDMAFASLWLPAAASRLAGAVQLWCHVVSLYWLFLIPILPLCALLERPVVLRWIPSPLLIGWTLLVGLLTSLLAGGTAALMQPEQLEFTGEILVIQGMMRALFVALAIGLSIVVLRRLDHVASRERFGRSTGALVTSAVAIALVAINWFALKPIGIASLPLLLAVAASLLLGILVKSRLPACSNRVVSCLTLGVVAFGIVGVFVPGSGRDHARWVLFSHMGPSAYSAWLVRRAVDFDGDGAASTWLSGADCAEGNAAIGPSLREVPHDGIDQDCRGGDSVAHSTQRALIGLMPPECQPPVEPRAVLLLVVDSLRGDHITPELTPNLFGLARAAWAFARAYSPTGRTASSMPALLSGRKLSDMGASNPVASDEFLVAKTLAETFRDSGYRTAVFHDLDFNAFSIRGFSARNPAWRDTPVPGPKHNLTSVGMARGYLEYLAASEQPSFALVHLGDVHAPYILDAGENGRELSESEAYARGVQYADVHVGELLNRLKAGGMLQRMVVALTADHGEELMQRGRHGHPVSVMEEAVQVPLIVHVPGCQPQLVSAPTSTSQLAPTLAAAAGIEYPGRGLFVDDGIPVVVEGASSSTFSHQRALYVGAHKLIVDAPNGGRVLFDLDSDPYEEDNLYGLDPRLTATMEEHYQRWLDAPGTR